MSYQQTDRSIQDGAPIECFKFTLPFGEFLYTTFDSEITLGGLGAGTYKPFTVSRTAADIGSIVDSVQTVDVRIPSNSDLALLYGYLKSPKDLVVEVFRTTEGGDYSSEYETEWWGEGLSVQSDAEWTTIKTGSILQSRLASTSSVYFQRSCNHSLYDARCKVNRADHMVTATVLKVQSRIITVDNDVYDDGVLNGGEIVVTRTGETQRIITSEDNVIRAGSRFIDIVVGDTVELAKGCNLARLGDCKAKFNNVANYGGFDFLPTINPYLDLHPDKFVVTEVRRSQKEQTQQGVSTSNTMRRR